MRRRHDSDNSATNPLAAAAAAVVVAILLLLVRNDNNNAPSTSSSSSDGLLPAASLFAPRPHRYHYYAHGFSPPSNPNRRSWSSSPPRASSSSRGARRISSSLPLFASSETTKKEEEVEKSSSEYLTRLIRRRLEEASKEKSKSKEKEDEDEDGASGATPEDDGDVLDDDDDDTLLAYRLAKGRFVDLTCDPEGETLLENLFLPLLDPARDGDNANGDGDDNNDDDGDHPADIRPASEAAIRRAVSSLQSLLIYGTQAGVKGSEEHQARLVRHLHRPGDTVAVAASGGGKDDLEWTETWDAECVRKLKHRRSVELGKRVLAGLGRKRTARGAFDLLVAMGAWKGHEDAALLRSGFPVRFTSEELERSLEAEGNDRDPDASLGMRRDLRGMKVYTIDGPNTEDIDDGISVEAMDENGGGDDDVDDGGAERRLRYWIHIADVDRWAPRGSKLLEAAERRGTSLYLPARTLCMFPPNMSSGVMSLEAWEDKHALSLGVELNSDGSVDASSVILTPSLVHVDYRLTYDQVDEMLDEGVGYTEEWQMGAMLAAATRRRAHRVGKGSTEGMVPFPIPRGMVSARYDEERGDHDISLDIETTHNSGANATTGGEVEGVAGDGDGVHYDPYCSPVSSSQLIVTEMMILAGEAIGKWQKLQPKQDGYDADGCAQLPNVLKLPFRRQPAPDFKSRERESRQMDFLYATNRRYPHAWYARRFFNKVAVSEKPGPHFGMGLDCYVQWSSPIRRLTDLQVHASLKRYLRRKHVNEMLLKGLPIPSQVRSMDLGYDISALRETATTTANGIAKAIDPIDYTSGLGMIFAARPVQSSSSNYWLFEYIRRRVDESEEEVMFESVVLGCVNADRFQYAVYVYELGLEHRYLSETGELEEGRKLWLKVSSVNPRMELLTFSLASRSGGTHARRLSAPAA